VIRRARPAAAGGRRRLGAAGLVAVLCSLAVGVVAGAQEEESPDVEDIEEIPVGSIAPATTVAQTTTTVGDLPRACTPIDPPYVEFVGRVSAYQIPIFRFDVIEVRSGEITGPQIDVRYPDDHRFIDLGHTYLVAAQLDPTDGTLYSKVRVTSKTAPKPGTCPGEDPIITTNEDGTSVDTAVLQGMRGKWRLIPLAFLVPLAAVLGALFVLAGARHFARWLLRPVTR
jgi:hypothetical protein